MHLIREALKSDGEASNQSQGLAARASQTEIRVKGKGISVPMVQIEGRTVIATGRWLKIAAVSEEELVEGSTIAEPELFIARLKKSGLNADLFTFAQRLPDTAPKHRYHIEWENAAVIPITSFSQWWNERTEYSTRKCVNRAKKLGVTVRVAEFNDQLIEAIRRIYNETPVRQGKAFWHYQRDFQSVRTDLATYLDRSIIIGAYHNGELIGFIKITYVGATAALTLILSAKKHFDKKPNNAMIAKAIEICELQGRSHLIYGSFVYYDPNSSLTEFKRHNGFEPVPLPRYYIPITLKGKIALKLGLHRGLVGRIPSPIFRAFLKIRKSWYARRLKAVNRSL